MAPCPAFQNWPQGMQPSAQDAHFALFGVCTVTQHPPDTAPAGGVETFNIPLSKRMVLISQSPSGLPSHRGHDCHCAVAKMAKNEAGSRWRAQGWIEYAILNGKPGTANKTCEDGRRLGKRLGNSVSRGVMTAFEHAAPALTCGKEAVQPCDGVRHACALLCIFKPQLICKSTIR